MPFDRAHLELAMLNEKQKIFNKISTVFLFPRGEGHNQEPFLVADVKFHVFITIGQLSPLLNAAKFNIKSNGASNNNRILLIRM